MPKLLAAGYAVMRGMGNSGPASSTQVDSSFSSGSRLNNQIDFPPSTPSSSSIMPRAFKVEAKSFGAGRPEVGNYGENRMNDGGYMTGGSRDTSWDDSALLSDDFLAGLAGNDKNTFSNLNSSRNQVQSLILMFPPCLGQKQIISSSYRINQLKIIFLIRLVKVEVALPLHWLIT